MSHCKIRHKNDDRCCDDDPDYWFRLGRDCDCDDRRCHCRPVFPRVISANLIIPQTTIPIQIVLGGGAGLTAGGASILQSISLTPQTTAAGMTIPFNTNLAAGNGIFTGF